MKPDNLKMMRIWAKVKERHLQRRPIFAPGIERTTVGLTKTF